MSHDISSFASERNEDTSHQFCLDPSFPGTSATIVRGGTPDGDIFELASHFPSELDAASSSFGGSDARQPNSASYPKNMDIDSSESPNLGVCQPKALRSMRKRGTRGGKSRGSAASSSSPSNADK